MNVEIFKNIFGDCELADDKIIIQKDLLKSLDFVKKTFGFDMLKEIVAVDNGNGEIELIYRLYSVDNDEDVKISISVKDEAESVSEMFDSAVADEKEIYDMFGIKFIGNKELKRLYMPESWKGNPLKKDYVEDDERLSWND